MSWTEILSDEWFTDHMVKTQLWSCDAEESIREVAAAALEWAIKQVPYGHHMLCQTFRAKADEIRGER